MRAKVWLQLETAVEWTPNEHYLSVLYKILLTEHTYNWIQPNSKPTGMQSPALWQLPAHSLTLFSFFNSMPIHIPYLN